MREVFALRPEFPVLLPLLALGGGAAISAPPKWRGTSGGNRLRRFLFALDPPQGGKEKLSEVAKLRPEFSLHYFARTTVAGVGVGIISTDVKPASLNHFR